MPTTIDEKSEHSSGRCPPASAIKAEVNLPRREEIERKLVGVRQYTPNTELSTPRWNPDISLYCHACQELVPIRELVPHKRYHREIRFFGLAGDPQPTLDQLISARNRKLRQLTDRLNGGRGGDGASTAAEAVALRSLDVERLNERFAFLKAFLFEEAQGRLVLASRPAEQPPAHDVESCGLRCSVPFVVSGGAARYHNPRFGRRARAFAAYQDWLGGDPGKCYAGLYAGRYGDTAAKLASEELHHFLLCELARFDPRTRCTCTFNMADTSAVVEADRSMKRPPRHDHAEIHRPATGASSERLRARLHWASANLVHTALRSCAERLDAYALAYARGRTPDLRWFNESEGESEGEGEGEDEEDSGNSDGWADKVSAAFTKALEYTDGLLKRGQSDYAAVRWSGASIGAVLLRSANYDAKDDVISDVTGRDDVINDTDSGKQPKLRPIGWLHAASCGDVQLMLVRNNRPHGLVSAAANRGIGYHGDPDMKRRLSCRPDCRCVPVDAECQAVVMATAGVTAVLRPAEICQLVATHLPVNRVRVDSCLEESDRRRLAGTETQASSASSASTSSASSSTTAARGNESVSPSPSPSLVSRKILAAAAVASTASSQSLDKEVGSLGEEVERQGDGEGECEGEGESWEVGLADEVARCVVQAALLAGSQEDLASLVLLLPAAFQLDWRPPLA